ncbi:MAG: GDP-mannose 4,6-dehydratase [Hyphomicrobium sp.]|uniref:NAD-dependent epimerase/dehydratase family protein n=1 Tax=Hyphomicrobium sp. TaxID=82 RepID=UPI0039E6215E
MRVMVTGASGFVGQHLLSALPRILGADVRIRGTSLGRNHLIEQGMHWLDVTDPDSVSQQLLDFRPTHVVNLAGIAAPQQANRDLDAAWKIHLQGTLNLARAIMLHVPECWLIHVSTGMVYGASAKRGVPVTEMSSLQPIDEYSASKAAADLAIGAMAQRGLRCIRFRPFNHTGPDQSEAFAVPAFAMQIARAEKGLSPNSISVGNLSAVRDFLDVRDVVAAYSLAIKYCDRLEPGTVLNLSSGVPTKLSDLLQNLLSMAHLNMQIEIDPSRMRPSDLPVFLGNSTLLRNTLNWTPRYTLSDTLAAVLDNCRERVAKEIVVNDL